LGSSLLAPINYRGGFKSRLIEVLIDRQSVVLFQSAATIPFVFQPRTVKSQVIVRRQILPR